MENKKILGKIKKLLSLAESSNQEEASLAAQRATELMTKHQISDAELEFADDELQDQVISELGNFPSWKSILLKGVAEGFGCRGYTQRRYRIGDGKRRTYIRVIGRDQDVAVVQYTYNYLINEINRLCDEAYAELSSVREIAGKSWKNSFRVGVASTIQNRMEEQRRSDLAKSNQETALVHIDQWGQRLEDYLNGKGVQANKEAPPTSDLFAYLRGREEGEQVSLGGNRGGLKKPNEQLSE